MIVKFIVTKDGNIYYGKRHFTLENHVEIAFLHGVDENEVKGGGIADFDACRISGTSKRFGPYDSDQVKKLLPNWEVEQPSIYYHLPG